jgi:hypothetical protein
MTEQTVDVKPPARPYFIPASVDFDRLPDEVKLAMIEIVGPTYEELVVMPASALERSAGVTLTFLLTVEILEQFELCESMNFSRTAEQDLAAGREKLIARHLRLVSAKQQATNFLTRLRLVRATKFTDPFRPSPV